MKSLSLSSSIAFVLLFFSCFSVLLPHSTYAQSSQKRSIKKKHKKKARRPKRFKRSNRVRLKKRKSQGFWQRFSASTGYSLTSDLSADKSPREYFHNFHFSPSFTVIPRFTLNSGLILRYSSLGSTIQSESVSADTDLFFGGTYSTPLGKWLSGKHSFSLNGEGHFPNSKEARLNGFKFIPNGAVSLTSQFWRSRYTLSQSIGVTYIANEFEFSPVNKKSNPEWKSSYNITNQLKIWKGLSANLGLSLSNTRFLNGTDDVSFGNSFGVQYLWKKFSIALSTSNQANASKESASLWFIDQDSRLTTASLSYTF